MRPIAGRVWGSINGDLLAWGSMARPGTNFDWANPRGNSRFYEEKLFRCAESPAEYATHRKAARGLACRVETILRRSPVAEWPACPRGAPPPPRQPDRRPH